MLKNIIFDLGGVIINIDYSLTIRAFKKLGVENFDELYSQAQQVKLFDQFETGRISPREFRDKIKKLMPPKISDYEIDKAWCAMLLNFPHERLIFLDKLRKDYRLFLLSNTNKIHISEVNKMLKSEGHWNLWKKFFDKKYYSHEAGMRKPDKKFFNLILKENHLKAQETLFIDDSVQNLSGASALGIKTHHLKKGKDITEISFQPQKKSKMI